MDVKVQIMNANEAAMSFQTWQNEAVWWMSGHFNKNVGRHL